MGWVIDRGNDSKILGERRRKRILAKLGHTFPGLKILELIRKRDQREEELRARGPGKEVAPSQYRSAGRWRPRKDKKP
jgi:hypothetical protein